MTIRLILIASVVLVCSAATCGLAAPGPDDVVNAALESAEASLPSKSDLDNPSFKVDPAQPVDLSVTLDLVDFESVNLAEALNILSKKTAVPINFPVDFPGAVSLYLENAALKDVLKIMADSHRLAYVVTDGKVGILTAEDFASRFGFSFNQDEQTEIIPLQHVGFEQVIARLTPLKSAAGKILFDRKANSIILLDTTQNLFSMKNMLRTLDVELATREFVLQFTQAQDVKERLKLHLTPEVGQIEVDEPQNKIIVKDSPAALEALSAQVRAIDKKREVTFTGKIVQVRLKKEYQRGIDWEAIVSRYQKLQLAQPVLPSDNIPLNLSVGTVSAEDFPVLLEALASVGELEDLDQTNARTLVNQSAVLLLDSRRAPVRLSKQSVAARKNPPPVHHVSVGMTIKPKWEDPDSLVMNIAPQVEWILKQRDLADVSEKFVPPELVLKTQNRETIVLGGLLAWQEVAKISKFPVFGDLPILGFAFRRQNKYIEAKEFVIFLTPQTETVDEPAAKPSAEPPAG